MQNRIRKVDVYMPSRSEYGVIHHFTQKLYEAFVRAGYICRLLEGEERFSVLLSDPPDLTICFNGAPRNKEGIYVCDIVSVPHVSCLIDPPFRFLELTASNWMFITCDDRFSAEMLCKLNFPRTFFMPHAVECDLQADSNQPRLYDVVMLATFIDYESRRLKWRTLFPQKVCEMMDQACEITLNDHKFSFIWTLKELLQPYISTLNLGPMVIKEIFQEVELYIKGKDRVDLISAIQDIPIHVFGTTIDEKGWSDYFKNNRYVITHPKVSFVEALNIIKQSKVILSSNIKNIEGAHERIFAGLACETLVATNDNAYMREQFDENEGLIFYKRSRLEEINTSIHYYLKHDEYRKTAVQKGRKKVMLYHTWDQRIICLMEEVEGILL